MGGGPSADLTTQPTPTTTTKKEVVKQHTTYTTNVNPLLPPPVVVQQQQPRTAKPPPPLQPPPDAMTLLKRMIGEKPTLKQCMRLAVSMAREQRDSVGKFRKDERHACMELYESLGLDDDEMFGPISNELQKQLRKYTFPPPNMNLLRDVATIDNPTMDLILGAEEGMARRREGLETGSGGGAPSLPLTVENTTRRQGVSSETLKVVSSNKAFKCIAKNKEQTSMLHAAMKNCVLFSCLDQRDQKTLFDAFELEIFNPGEVVFEEGDLDGDKFYMVSEGACKIELSSGITIRVTNGAMFGELGVMYGTPRAATVTATLPSALWSMDRDTYRSTLMRQMVNKRDLHMKFLDSVPILSSMDVYEKARISDVLDVKTFHPKHVICREGDVGECMYFLEEGTVQVTKGSFCKMLEPGAYFGELALLHDQPRKATCVAESRCRVLCLSRRDFSSALGPLESILRRNLTHYEQYVAELNKK